MPNITSPMVGKIFRIECTVGQQVSEGDVAIRGREGGERRIGDWLK